MSANEPDQKAEAIPHPLSHIPLPPSAVGPAADPVPFASNAVRLTLRQWAGVTLVIALVIAAAPRAWKHVEPIVPRVNERVPFRLGSDYWTFQRYCDRAVAQEKLVVLGDSVVWGHYVSTDNCLSAHLNRFPGGVACANLGVDGIHPAALAGLIDCYASSLAGRKVLLQCNLLWMGSPQHDLSTDKEFSFNHPLLVPQFSPWIPCYRESLSGRLGNVVVRNSDYLSWARHLRIAYLDSADWASWTVDHPYQNPLAQITGTLPSPDEPPSPPPVAESWTAQRIPKANFRWVELDRSLQWQSFRRAVETLQARGNEVFVLVGPFNEPMLKERSLQQYQVRKQAVGQQNLT